MNFVLKDANRLVRPITDADDVVMHEMMEEMAKNNADQQVWLKDADYGFVCLFRNEARWPGKVVEYVKGSKGDSVSSLYEMSQAFTSEHELGRLRKDLILEIAAKLNMLPSMVGLKDSGRGRSVPMREVGTAQLIDLLTEITN